MANNLPALLAELSERAPDVCKSLAGCYEIGVYRFWTGDSGQLYATVFDADNSYARGQPAYDWLQGALQRAIIDKYGAIFSQWSQVGDHQATICNISKSSSEMTGALLTALIAAVKGE